jgi:hypothetical protein
MTSPLRQVEGSVVRSGEVLFRSGTSSPSSGDESSHRRAVDSDSICGFLCNALVPSQLRAEASPPADVTDSALKPSTMQETATLKVPRLSRKLLPERAETATPRDLFIARGVSKSCDGKVFRGARELDRTLP